MFKVGDMVKCIEGGGSLMYGMVYRVVRISKYKDTPFVHVLSTEKLGESGGWFPSRFVLVKPKPAFKGNKQ